MNSGLFYNYYGRALDTFDALDNVKRALELDGDVNTPWCRTAVTILRQRLRILWGAMPRAFDYWNKLDSINGPGELAALLKQLERDLEQFKDDHFYPEHGRMLRSTEWYVIDDEDIAPPDPPRFF